MLDFNTASRPGSPKPSPPQTRVASDKIALKEQIRNAIKGEDELELNSPELRREFKFSHIGDVVKSVKPIDWLIEGVMEDGTLCDLFGDPGSFKSFLALDWALSIATGTTWGGHKVKQGPVFIFIGEGHNGYGRRIKAWIKAMGKYVSDAPVFINKTPLQVLDQQSAESAAIAIRALQEQHGKPVLVLFDTLARVFGPGDENSTADMTRFIATLDSFIDKDITRLLVHHTGHGDKQRGRGSSALKAALDAEYHLERDDELVTLHCRKMKDAPEFSSMSFKPEIVEIGTFEEPMTSVYLKVADSVKKAPVTLTPQMNQSISLLKLMGNEKCLRCLSEWRDFCLAEGVYTRTAFYNAVKKLEDKKVITITDGNVELSSMY